MSKLSVIVAAVAVGAVMTAAGPALPAPAYVGGFALGMAPGAEQSYFGRSDVGYLVGVPFGPRRAARIGPFVSTHTAQVRRIGGNVVAYSAAPSSGGGLRHLGGNVWTYSGTPSYGVVSLPTGAAFGWPSASAYAEGYGPTRYLDTRGQNAMSRRFHRRRHSRMAATIELNPRAGGGIRPMR